MLKPSPEHISVVGPKYYGKSVVLRHIAEKFRVESCGFLTTVYIDLKYGTPRSDGAFKRRLAEEITSALQPVRTQLAEMIHDELVDAEDADVYELLDLVFGDELESKNERILVILDGFDWLLASPRVTRNLWDQLRSLAQKTSLTIVTGSRLELRELCRTEDSRSSDFWEIFDANPVRIFALEDDDWGDFLRPLVDDGCKLDESARKEIAKWTGGVPLLVSAFLRELWDNYRNCSQLSKMDVDQAAESVLEGGRQLLAALWDDCDFDLQAKLEMLANAGISKSCLQSRLLRELVQRGFGRVSGKQLRGACRLMQRYAEEQAPAVADLTRLFGSTKDYEANIRSLLELRLKQITTHGIDRDLLKYVRNAVREIDPHDPNDALIWIRSIVNRALDLIWRAELQHEGTLPESWQEEGTSSSVIWSASVQGRLPHSRGKQCHILRQITRSDRMQSRYITKKTSLLVDHLRWVGNFGQHRDEYPGSEVSVGFVAAIVLSAISMVETLTDDLQRPRSIDPVRFKTDRA